MFWVNKLNILSGLNLKVSEKRMFSCLPIDEFPVRTLSPLIVDKKINYTGINVDRKIGLEQINEINDKKIIGLGESVHGNDGIKNLAYQLIIQAVERLNCKLVLQEMPLEQSFA